MPSSPSSLPWPPPPLAGPSSLSSTRHSQHRRRHPVGHPHRVRQNSNGSADQPRTSTPPQNVSPPSTLPPRTASTILHVGTCTARATVPYVPLDLPSISIVTNFRIAPFRSLSHTRLVPASALQRDAAYTSEDAVITEPVVDATATDSVSTPTDSPSPSTTIKPYTMTFQVTNIPPGWQKDGRTHFYSKGMIIGFSVTLAVLIVVTIVGCVIWRVRVARGRRDAEKALEIKKADISRGMNSPKSICRMEMLMAGHSTRWQGRLGR